MKKGIYLALSMMLVLGAFTACGGGKDKDNDNSTPDSVTSETPAGSEGEGSEGGEDQKPVIPEDLDVAGAIAIGQDYASKVTHGKLVNFTDAYYDNTEYVLYAFGSDFTYEKSTTQYMIEDELSEDVYEMWNSLDKNGNIFSVKNDMPNMNETSVEMMNGYGFNMYYVLGGSGFSYGVEGLISSLYNMAAEEYAYYEQCLEDAELAGDADLIADVQYVMDNCGFTESVSEGVYSFTMTYADDWGDLYLAAVEFTLNEEGYIATAKVASTCYNSEGYTFETKTIIKADEDLGIAEVTANVYAVNEGAEATGGYSIDAQQNCALTEADVIPTENQYDAELLLVSDFAMSKDGAAVEDGAVIEMNAGDYFKYNITVAEGTNVNFSDLFFTIDGEEADPYGDERLALTSVTNWDTGTMDGFAIRAKKAGEYTVEVVYGAAKKTLTVKVAPALPTSIEVYAKDNNFVQYNDQATVYTGSSLFIYVEADSEFVDASHTLVLSDTTNASITENEYGTKVFVSNVPGTYTITVTSTAVPSLTDTLTIVVEEAPSVADILVGKWEAISGQETYTVEFSESAQEVSMTVESVDGEGPVTGVYSYVLNGVTIELTLISGTDVALPLAVTESFGLALTVTNEFTGFSYPVELTKVVEGGEEGGEEPLAFASELYYDASASLYMSVQSATRLSISDNENPNQGQKVIVLIDYVINANGNVEITVVKDYMNSFTFTGNGFYNVENNTVEIGYINAMTQTETFFVFSDPNAVVEPEEPENAFTNAIYYDANMDMYFIVQSATSAAIADNADLNKASSTIIFFDYEMNAAGGMTLTNINAISNSNGIELKGTGSYYLPLMSMDMVEINYTLNGAMTRKFNFNPYTVNEGGEEGSNLAEILIGTWSYEGYYMTFETDGTLLISDSADLGSANEFEVYSYACNGETFTDWMGTYEIVDVTFVEAPFGDDFKLSFTMGKVFYDASVGELWVEYTNEKGGGLLFFTKA